MHIIGHEQDTIVVVLERHDMREETPQDPAEITMARIRAGAGVLGGAAKVLYIDQGRIFMIKNRFGACGDIDAAMDISELAPTTESKWLSIPLTGELDAFRNWVKSAATGGFANEPQCVLAMQRTLDEYKIQPDTVKRIELHESAGIVYLKDHTQMGFDF